MDVHYLELILQGVSCANLEQDVICDIDREGGFRIRQ